MFTSWPPAISSSGHERLYEQGARGAIPQHVATFNNLYI